MGKKSKQKYICPCYKITKADMKEAIQQGVVRFKDYRAMTNIGDKCTSCKKKNKERFKKYKRKLGV